jgi:hypothetical protein
MKLKTDRRFEAVTNRLGNVAPKITTSILFLSARKADLKKGFQHLVLLLLLLLVVCTRVKKSF